MKKMDAKGQVSVEYILIIFVIIIVMGSVTLPLVGNSTKTSMDISKTSDVSTAVNSIANAVNVVYSNGPGAKRTLSLYIPVSGSLTYDSSSNSLKMYVNGVAKNSSTPLNESNPSTMKIVDASVPYNVTVTPSTLTKKWYTVTVEWPLNSTGSILVTFS